jgi:hypothetical protein
VAVKEIKPKDVAAGIKKVYSPFHKPKKKEADNDQHQEKEKCALPRT